MITSNYLPKPHTQHNINININIAHHNIMTLTKITTYHLNYLQEKNTNLNENKKNN